MELRPDQIEALKKIEEEAIISKALKFDKKTELLDDLLNDNNLKDKIYDEILKTAEHLKQKYHMTMDDSEILDNLIFETNAKTLRAISSLKSVLIFIE